MTTTTLSSNKSSEKLFDRKLFSMMAGCLRQNVILMAMYTVGLLLATVLIEAFYASSNDPATSIFPLIGSLLSFASLPIWYRFYFRQCFFTICITVYL